MKWLVPLLLATPTVAFAQERDYCADRPGLGTPACTMSPGKVSVEMGLADWERDTSGDVVTDTVLIADTEVRVGLTENSEALVGWTPLGIVRERDKATGAIDRRTRAGDVTLGFKRNFSHPDDEGFAIALLPTVTLPVGRVPVGAGDWGAALQIPASYQLTDRLQVQATPEIDAAVDDDHRGRHLAYGSVIGVGYDLTDDLMANVEVQMIRDEDPMGHSTQTRGAVALAWSANDDMIFDIGGVAGLNRDTPDMRLYAGIARRF